MTAPKKATSKQKKQSMIAQLFDGLRQLRRALYLRSRANYYFLRYLRSNPGSWRSSWYCRFSNRLERLKGGRSPWKE